MTPGAIIAVGAWGSFCAVLAFGVFNEIRACWRRRREARQVDVLNRCWSIPSREPIRTKLP